MSAGQGSRRGTHAPPLSIPHCLQLPAPSRQPGHRIYRTEAQDPQSPPYRPPDPSRVMLGEDPCSVCPQTGTFHLLGVRGGGLRTLAGVACLMARGSLPTQGNRGRPPPPPDPRPSQEGSAPVTPAPLWATGLGWARLCLSGIAPGSRALEPESLPAAPLCAPRLTRGARAAAARIRARPEQEEAGAAERGPRGALAQAEGAQQSDATQSQLRAPRPHGPQSRRARGDFRGPRPRPQPATPRPRRAPAAPR